MGMVSPDLAVANGNFNASSITILLGNGDGTFKAGPTLTAPTLTLDGLSPIGVAVGDFNGDGNLDLAVMSSYVNQFSVTIFVGNGDGTFSEDSTTPAGAGTHTPTMFAVADFNTEGKLDIAIVKAGTATSGAEKSFAYPGGPYR